ncbi:MAG: hypothetical protein ACTSQI_19995 [Candidatus Helarchaeota archaeon]
MNDSERIKLKEKVLNYLKEKGVAIDDSLLKYLEGGFKLTDQDEFMEPTQNITTRAGILTL